jgi:hypothetical protein
MRIKEQVSEKRSTVCTNGYANCRLKNMSSKHNKYVINEIKDTTDTDRSASYLDIHLRIDSVVAAKNKRDHFNFPIVNFPFICSNIPAAPVYGVYIYLLSVDTIFQSMWFLSRFP